MRKKLGVMLVEAGALSEQGLRMALAEQRRWGGTIGRTLVEMKLISETELVDTLSKQLHLPTIDLDKIDIHPTVIELVPPELADQHTLIPFAQPMKFLDVAMSDPTNLGVIDELRIRTQLNIRPYLAGPKVLERAIGKYYGRGFGRVTFRRDQPIVLEGGGDVIAERAKRPSQAPPPSRHAVSIGMDGLKPFPRDPGEKTRPVPTVSLEELAAPAGPPPLAKNRDAEIDALQDRISALEALVARDEEVLRKLLALLVEKRVATREEILERIR